MSDFTNILMVVFFVLVIASLFGFWFARRRFKKKMARLDKQLNTPETIQQINEQLDEQQIVTNEREVRENDRRRAIFRGYGDRDLQPIELGRGEHAVKRTEPTDTEPIGQHIDSTTNGGSSELSDTEPSETTINNQRDTEPTRNPEEDWEDFS